MTQKFASIRYLWCVPLVAAALFIFPSFKNIWNLPIVLLWGLACIMIYVNKFFLTEDFSDRELEKYGFYGLAFGAVIALFTLIGSSYSVAIIAIAGIATGVIFGLVRGPSYVQNFGPIAKFVLYFIGSIVAAAYFAILIGLIPSYVAWYQRGMAEGILAHLVFIPVFAVTTGLSFSLTDLVISRELQSKVQ